MGNKSVRDYIFNKLFFPKVAIIDKPGIIINQISRKYGNIKSRHRTIFYFEDILADLQLETQKMLGKEESKQLYYNIGIDGMKRYLLHGQAKKVPMFLLKPTLRYIFDGFVSAGYTAAKNFSYDSKKNKFVLTGEDNITCRKSGQCEQFCGGLSVLMNLLISKSFIVNSRCDKERCRIIATSIPDKSEDVTDDFLKIEKEYQRINFPRFTITSHDKFHSFSDLIKFKKIEFDEKGKYYFQDKVIGPSPQDLFGLIEYHYRKINRIDILEKAVVKSSLKLMNDLKKDILNKKEGMMILKTIISAFGLGVPYINQEKNKLILRLIHPPITKFGFHYNTLMIQGFLQSILSKKISFKEIYLDKQIPSITLHYTLN